jgi:hypothetical protein
MASLWKKLNKVNEDKRGFCLKHFKITERLGEGGFAQVVLAKQSTGGHSSSEEVFALNLVPTKHMSVVE